MGYPDQCQVLGFVDGIVLRVQRPKDPLMQERLKFRSAMDVLKLMINEENLTDEFLATLQEKLKE